MTLHKITNGGEILCSECYKSHLPLGNIMIPYSCLICKTKPTPDTRQVCGKCLLKIREQHTIDMHMAIDLV